MNAAAMDSQLDAAAVRAKRGPVSAGSGGGDTPEAKRPRETGAEQQARGATGASARGAYADVSARRCAEVWGNK